MKSLKLIVGLGNPGTRYRNTKHNIGFKIVDSLGKAYKIKISKEIALSQVGTGNIKSSDIVLAKPQTYVNNSGKAVKKLLDAFSFSVENLLVVHDDLDLEKGVLKIKQRGSDGGHNGLKSIIRELESDNFLRLRLGIGRPSPEGDVVDYVLSAFDEENKEWLQSLADRAIKAVEILLTGGITAAMNEFNRRS